MRFSAGTHYLNTILHKYNPLSLKTEEKMEHYNEEAEQKRLRLRKKYEPMSYNTEILKHKFRSARF